MVQNALDAIDKVLDQVNQNPLRFDGHCVFIARTKAQNFDIFIMQGADRTIAVMANCQEVSAE